MKLTSFVEKNAFRPPGRIPVLADEDNTHSFTMEDDIRRQEVKQEERADTIMELQQGISQELNQHKIGNTYKVLFDRKEGGYFIGRTEVRFSPRLITRCWSRPASYVRLGDLRTVKSTPRRSSTCMAK